jgi:hypothetical protein
MHARRRPISKGSHGMQIILKRFYQRENPFGFGLKQNKLTDSLGFSDWRHLASHLSQHEISMEHMQNCKKWFELKTRLGKNCTIDKFNSEGRPNICGIEAFMKPELACFKIT